MSDLLQGINVFLIGMMGTGKSTVGKSLAQKLNYRFLDTDALIERIARQTIEQIFATEGENSFRELESRVLAEVSAYTRTAIATGGGIVVRSKNWSYLHHGLIVWLDAPVELLMQRLAGDTSRPLLQQTNAREKLEFLLQARQSFYAQADLHVPIAPDRTPDEIALQIVEKIPTVLRDVPAERSV